MIISAHQPAYNPWLGYIHKLLISDKFVVMDDVQFEKNSFINRNKILQKNSEIMLTIPVKTKNYKEKKIKDIEIADHYWKNKHLKSIEQAYKKSPLFDYIFSFLIPIYQIKSDFLIDYTNAYLDFFIKYLEIDTSIIWASDLSIKSKKLDYVCELTEKLNGDTFIFGAQGKGYATAEDLNSKKIIPYFQEYNHPEYRQSSKKTIPNMGGIDILFNENKANVTSLILKGNISKSKLRDLIL